MSNSVTWDCHMHSFYSADSVTPMETMIQAAVQKGLDGICFTEHVDPDYPPTPDGQILTFDSVAYKKGIFELQEKYKSQIEVLYGVEIGLQPHLADFFHQYLASEPFDFVIGSSHLVHGVDPYYGQLFIGREERECYMEYFESILENLAAFSEMDVYGHIDYIVRYGPNQNKDYSYEKYKDILDEILKTIVSKNLGIEVNAGGLHYGLGEPNPCSDIIRRYRELGGEIITTGADAHDPSKIAYDFDKIHDILVDCGFKYYTVFKNRKPEFLPL